MWRRVWRKSDGADFRRPNAKSLDSSASGKVTFGRNVLLERGLESQTVEFFARVAEGDADAATFVQHFAYLSRDGKIESHPGWSVGKTAAGGICVGIRDDAATFDGESIADGKWHHIAVTFKAQNYLTDTKVAVYVDYAPYGDAHMFENLVVPQGTQFANSSLEIGPVAGRIDEVRVSPGVLGVAEMMFSPLQSGLVSVFK